MKFLFKIWSNFDGFVPAEIPNRRQPNGQILLGWTRYIESVERGTEIWVYFHGRHRFENGVYLKGVAQKVDLAKHQASIRIRKVSTDRPLTDDATSERIAEVVAPRNRQVFILPEELDYSPVCDVATTAESCARRQCGSCKTWRTLRRIRRRNLGTPKHLGTEVAGFVPAYWVIPPRNFIHSSGRRIITPVKKTSELFYRFKTGEESLAFPLALGISDRLAKRSFIAFDGVVPVPLSPEKEARGEIHRTRLLATELSRLLGCPRRDLLSLTAPVSKKSLRLGRGFSANDFAFAYRMKLAVVRSGPRYKRLLLVDDVCTEGSTLTECAKKLRSTNPGCEVIAATAGQMTVRAAVQNEDDLIDE